MSTIRSCMFTLATLAIVVLGVRSAPADSDAEAAYKKLLTVRGDTLVAVKFVLKINMAGMFGAAGEQESEEEIEGVMIAPDGLVLVSNTQLGGFVGMMRNFMGEMAGQMSAVPTDLKVLVGEDTEGVEATLLARDTELDLAWIKIKEPGEKKFSALDLAKSAKPKLGDELLMLTRMSKYFGRAAVVYQVHVAGFAKKPRDLYVLSGSTGGPGLAVYNSDGELVGVTILQVPESEGEEGNPFAMFSRMSEMGTSMGGLILPAEEVLKATQRAKETAATEAESAKPAEGEKPAEPEKPTEPESSGEPNE